MKLKISIVIAVLAAVATLLVTNRVSGAGTTLFQTQELITIRWAGRENTHLIRSNGKVERLNNLLSKSIRPDYADERSFYLNVAMNALTKEGYEFAGMTPDEIVMKRPMPKE